ncbi:GAF domain-containing sensor histidine kinase [Leptodesmis sichuanensis]|uniref:GAF domain-containing sensor histidine kinase n=1 Tax=Leptodesmis sichuanensis TaxID=2906798 RepID=UPI001F3F6B15|nr:GAF domain-containing protein [Leptodesmis sichuanensis]UIE39730.1 GAF domain-containing protein [Leptodesmis sichuanensis A121]
MPNTIEPHTKDWKLSALLSGITEQIQRSLDLQNILQVAVNEVRAFLPSDRVMVYKFHPDESGQVIAESVDQQRLPSLLGLNFPADDIPTKHRELFVRSKVRSIVNVAARKIGQSAMPGAEITPDIEDITYRPLDACHQEYLTAMGVQSSVVVPIIHHERLWGLLVAHHSEPRTIPLEELQILQMVVDQFAVAIAQAELLAQAQDKAQRETTINRIADLLNSLSTIDLQTALEETVIALNGVGGRLYLLPTTFNAKVAVPGENQPLPTGTLYICGTQPTLPEQMRFHCMEQYPIWQDHFATQSEPAWVIPDVYQVPELRNLQPGFKSTSIRGILAIPLQYREQLLGYLTVFRSEIEVERLWAGWFDPDERQVQPRLSFEVWKESKQGQLHLWTEADVELAQVLGRQFATAIQQYAMHQQVQAFNTQLEAQVAERTAELQLAGEQQAVLLRVVTKIRESLDLQHIFKTTVTEVRQSLQVDRVIVFRLDPGSNFDSGQVIAEAVVPPFVATLGRVIRDHCFGEKYAAEYQQGKIYAIANIDDAELQNCHRELLTHLQVVANLLVPLRKGNELWGLLGVHSCTQPRTWSSADTQFLTQIAAQLDVALQQGELLAQTQQQAKQLAQALDDLKHAHTHLVQTEKMSSLGQLVAGIAHEINNPVNFIYGNLAHVSSYAQDLLGLVELYQQHYPNPVQAICDRAEEIDLDFLTEDLQKTLSSMRIGADRIRQIVLSLRNFSRLDQAEMKPVDIHDGIDSTLLILQYRLKPKSDRPEITIIKDYGNLPLVECYAGQLNQVFMNVLGNAIEALEDAHSNGHWAQTNETGDKADRSHSLPDSELPCISPTIRIQTQMTDDQRVQIRFFDNGPGIPEAIRQRIFDPFFTTKPVGKGTGLGLSISYKIVVEKHGGMFKCESQPGQGTTFLVEVPAKQSGKADDSDR